MYFFQDFSWFPDIWQLPISLKILADCLKFGKTTSTKISSCMEKCCSIATSDLHQFSLCRCLCPKWHPPFWTLPRSTRWLSMTKSIVPSKKLLKIEFITFFLNSPAGIGGETFYTFKIFFLKRTLALTGRGRLAVTCSFSRSQLLYYSSMWSMSFWLRTRFVSRKFSSQKR